MSGRKKIQPIEVSIEAAPIEKAVETPLLKGMIRIIATSKSKYLIAGNEYLVSSELATTLISKGNAILKQ